MNIPAINCKIEMFCTINPSESSEKIEKAISNIFPYSIINNNDFSISAQSKELRSFEKIYRFIYSYTYKSSFPIIAAGVLSKATCISAIIVPAVGATPAPPDKTA